MALNRSPEFKSVIVQTICVLEIQFESVWALTNITSGATCHAKFHASWGKRFRRKSFQYFPVHFYGSNPGPLWRVHFWNLRSQFKKTMLSNTRQCHIPKSKQLSLEKRIFLNILLANPISPGIRPFWTNLVQDHYKMLQTKFQVFHPRGSEEDDWMFFSLFSVIQT